MQSFSAEFTNLNGCYFYFLGARAGGVAPPALKLGGVRPGCPILYAYERVADTPDSGVEACCFEMASFLAISIQYNE